MRTITAFTVFVLTGLVFSNCTHAANCRRTVDLMPELAHPAKAVLTTTQQLMDSGIVPSLGPKDQIMARFVGYEVELVGGYYQYIGQLHLLHVAMKDRESASLVSAGLDAFAAGLVPGLDAKVRSLDGWIGGMAQPTLVKYTKTIRDEVNKLRLILSNVCTPSAIGSRK